MKTDVSRRTFLSGAAVVGASALAAGLAGCSNGTGASNAAEGSEETEAAAPVEHNPANTETCDIVVVGSGTAGMAAAARARQLGANVIQLEKNPYFGGSSGYAEGIGAINSYMHRDAGLEFDVDEAFLRTQDYHHWAATSDVLRQFIQESGNTIDWLHDECGIEFYTATVTAPTSYPSWHLGSKPDGTLGRILDTYINPMADYLAEIGVDARLECPATGLIVENDVVKGVYYTDPDGVENAIEANAVILATGGYASNPELFEEFSHIPHERVHDWGTVGRDGDGITWARELGAALHFPSNVMFGSTQIHGANEFEDLAGWIFAWNPGLRVNEKAQRFFNEMLMADFSVAGNSIINQEKCFTIIDQAYLDQCCKVALPQGLESVGYITGEPLEGAQEAIDAAVEDGRIFKADTLEDLAAQLGLDPDALVATVDGYNACAEAGEDKMFGCIADALIPVKTAPFYGAQNNPAMFATVGGLNVDTQFRVLREDGTIIENLYAIGGDASSYTGTCYDVGIMSGAQQGWCATGGRLTAEYILGER